MNVVQADKKKNLLYYTKGYLCTANITKFDQWLK